MPFIGLWLNRFLYISLLFYKNMYSQLTSICYYASLIQYIKQISPKGSITKKSNQTYDESYVLGITNRMCI